MFICIDNVGVGDCIFNDFVKFTKGFEFCGNEKKGRGRCKITLVKVLTSDRIECYKSIRMVNSDLCVKDR